MLLLMLGVFGWAWASLDRSSTARAMWWRDADVEDQFRFPARLIQAGDEVSALAPGSEIEIPATIVSDADAEDSFDAFLRDHATRAFLVVQDDQLIYERYFDGADPGDRQTSFSVAKSFVSTLVGIAVDEELIGSVTDPVTEYVPELMDRDPRFAEITLRDLLTMSSGLRYVEPSIPTPWGDDVQTYYGTDLREVALNATEITGPPGKVWLYNNYNPLLLGMVIERVSGMSVSAFMSDRLWKPLGAEEDATWSLDSRSSGFEKMESGLNASPMDYARFGDLYLHGGEANGEQIVSRDWVEAATSAEVRIAGSAGYGYFWWLDAERPGRYYALGNLGQYVYVAPDANAVIVRLGEDWGADNSTWRAIFRSIADGLADGSLAPAA
jgi:CubicO group peptidase (beta-lactamase class C family)